MLLSKQQLVGKLEPSILERMPDVRYQIKWKRPEELVTWNRLDIGMRTSYLELKDKVPELASSIYYEDLRAQTLGSLVDPDNPSKSSFETFKNVFSDVSEEIYRNGFDSEKTLLPLAISGSILNGGHRLSAALAYNKPVACIETQIPPITCDYQYFFNRAVPQYIIEQAVLRLLRFMDDAFIAFLWPSGIKNIKQTVNLFHNKVYEKELILTNNGALNLLYQCYHHMEWIGTKQTGYRGLYKKLFECFPETDTLTIIIFQAAGGLDEVRQIKQEVRDINGIGFSSIHITDTKEELIRLANLACNENGLHYLNNAGLIDFDKVELIKQLRSRASKLQVDRESFVVDGSLLTDIYGLRKADDIDIVAASKSTATYDQMGFDSRVSELKYHRKSADELVYDPRCHFYLFGIKFVGFHQLVSMKKNRLEPKDVLDVKLMLALGKRNRWKMFVTRIRQRVLYARIRSRRSIFRVSAAVLSVTGLYAPVRAVYRRLKGL